MKKKFFDVGTFMYLRCNKCGAAAVIGFAALASAAVEASAQEDANDTNVQLTRESMAQQEKLFHEGNDFNAEQAELARQFNAQEAQTNRMFQAGQLNHQMNWYENYNSAAEQVKRYMQAGLNPASLGGKLDYSGSFGVPSGAAATATPASAASAPSVPRAEVQPVNPLQGVLKGATEAFSSYMQSRKTGAETQGILTENNFKEITIKKGLELSDSEIKKNYQQANLFVSESDLANKKIDETGAIIRNLDASSEKLDVETQIENIRKMYASDFYKYQVKELEQKYKFTKGLAETIVKLTYSRIAANYGQAASAFSNAEYMSAYAKLAPFEQDVLDNTADVLDTQNKREKYSLFLDKQFGWKERFWKNESLKEGVDRQQYENSSPYRVMQGIKDVAVGVGAAGGAAYGAYKGVKGFKFKKNYIYGNPKFNYSVTPEY